MFSPFGFLNAKVKSEKLVTTLNMIVHIFHAHNRNLTSGKRTQFTGQNKLMKPNSIPKQAGAIAVTHDKHVVSTDSYVNAQHALTLTKEQRNSTMPEQTHSNTWDFDDEDQDYQETANRQSFNKYDTQAYYGYRSQLNSIYDDIDRMKKKYLKKKRKENK